MENEFKVNISLIDDAVCCAKNAVAYGNYIELTGIESLASKIQIENLVDSTSISTISEYISQYQTLDSTILEIEKEALSLMASFGKLDNETVEDIINSEIMTDSEKIAVLSSTAKNSTNEGCTLITNIIFEMLNNGKISNEFAADFSISTILKFNENGEPTDFDNEKLKALDESLVMWMNSANVDSTVKILNFSEEYMKKLVKEFPNYYSSASKVKKLDSMLEIKGVSQEFIDSLNLGLAYSMKDTMYTREGTMKYGYMTNGLFAFFGHSLNYNLGSAFESVKDGLYLGTRDKRLGELDCCNYLDFLYRGTGFDVYSGRCNGQYIYGVNQEIYLNALVNYINNPNYFSDPAQFEQYINGYMKEQTSIPMEEWDSLKPGDLFENSGHTRMVVETYPGENKVLLLEEGNGSAHYQVYTYESLKNENYVAVNLDNLYANDSMANPGIYRDPTDDKIANELYNSRNLREMTIPKSSEFNYTDSQYETIFGDTTYDNASVNEKTKIKNARKAVALAEETGLFGKSIAFTKEEITLEVYRDYVAKSLTQKEKSLPKDSLEAIAIQDVVNEISDRSKYYSVNEINNMVDSLINVSGPSTFLLGGLENSNDLITSRYLIDEMLEVSN